MNIDDLEGLSKECLIVYKIIFARTSGLYAPYLICFVNFFSTRGHAVTFLHRSDSISLYVQSPREISRGRSNFVASACKCKETLALYDAKKNKRTGEELNESVRNVLFFEI